jgi:hypothetical protein
MGGKYPIVSSRSFNGVTAYPADISQAAKSQLPLSLGISQPGARRGKNSLLPFNIR